MAAGILVPLAGLVLLWWSRLAPSVWPALLAVVVAACFVPHVLANFVGRGYAAAAGGGDCADRRDNVGADGGDGARRALCWR
ncbi:MAG: hypothetical protein WDN04_11830 [Rhodospirillales bacterium]